MEIPKEEISVEIPIIIPKKAIPVEVLKHEIPMEIPEEEFPKQDTVASCTFGIIADVQYADIPDGTNYSGTRSRYYRNSLIQLKSAVTEMSKLNVDFVIDLGDLVDGFSKREKQSHDNLKTLLDEYKKLCKPVYHLWGNHEFYNFRRTELIMNKDFNSSLRKEVTKPADSSDANYYHFSPCCGFRVICLDPYEISVLGYNTHDPNFIKAKQIVRKVNKNSDLHSHRGMYGKDVRFVKYNGALSDTQLLWLDNILDESDSNCEKVIINSHLPVWPDASDNHTMMWNYDLVLDILHKHSCVSAFFAGHNHDGGYAIDTHGIHHITFHGIIESRPDQNTFAVVEVNTTGIFVKGFGRIPDFKLGPDILH